MSRFMVGLWVCLLTWALAAVALAAQTRAGHPVKLVVTPEALETAVGRETSVEVALRDAQNRLASAPKTLTIEATIAGAEVDRRRLQLTFRPGDTTQSLTVTPSREGLVEIRADHPELRQGGAFVQVVSPDTLQAMGTAKRLLEAEKEGRPDPDAPAAPVRPRPLPPMPGPKEGSPRTRSRVVLPDRLMPQRELVERLAEPKPPSSDEDPGTEPPKPSMRLILRASPVRGLLANGQDPSTIYAFLQGGAAGASPLRVNLVPDAGELSPTPLEIRPGQGAGTARLTASRPGKVRIEFISARPPAALEGEPILEVDFSPPITGLKVKAAEQIALGESLDLVVWLVDSDRRGVATRKPRSVSFAIESGHGELQQHEVEIPSGGIKAHTRFVADWWRPGQTSISVTSANLLTRTVPVDVGWPWRVLLVIAAGSLCGGLIAWTHGNARRRYLMRRLFTGLVTGVMLYTLYRFVAPRPWVSNPFGAFLVAAIGGWLGTKVFERVIRRIL